MSTQSEEGPRDGNQRRKSIGGGSGGTGGLSGGKTRRYSFGVTSTRKSIGEEVNTVPNYLRASTGSCHDFCKYGKKHEFSKSEVPVKFKATPIVNKDRFTKTVVVPEKKKTAFKASTNTEHLTNVEPVKVTKKVVSLLSKKPQALKQSSSTNRETAKKELKMPQQPASLMKTNPVVVNRDGYNDGIKKVDLKTLKKTGVTPKSGGVKVKKVDPKAKLNESQFPKGSFSKAASLNSVKHRSVKQAKQVSPLKDQNRMQKTKPKQTVDDNVQAKILHNVEAEPQVKPETMEFDSIQSSMESISDPICNSSESFLGKNVVEEESVITHPVNESSEIFTDKELLEESLTALGVAESSQSCSDKDILEEESSIPPLLSESSESFYDDEVLDEESEYTDDDEDDNYDDSNDDEEAKVSKGSETADVIATDPVGNQNKIPRKGRVVISEDKDDKAVKLRFRRGKILELKSEDNGPKRLKFRRRVTEGNTDGHNIATRAYKNKSLDLQTEINDPTKLKFATVKGMEGKEVRQRVSRRSFEKKYIEEKKDSNNGPESVVLKHQGEQGKKDAQGLLNNVIEETACKLVESRKSKVKALVGAFETVISLQDGKPSST